MIWVYMDGGRRMDAASGVDFVTEDRERRLIQALEFAGELANLCVFSDTGRICPYCRCERLPTTKSDASPAKLYYNTTPVTK